MSTLPSIAHVLLALLLAPLMPGVINRVKAWFAGRRGPPLVQGYRDLSKLLHKGAVYSKTTTWLFVAGPIIGLACILTALLIVPLGSVPSLISFQGDFLLAAYLLALMRFFTILAALDTGSSFEGMGASREAFYSALAEPALLLALAAMATQSGSLSLSPIYAAVNWHAMTSLAGPALLLVAAALLIVFLTENARIPVDDPNTHLELTMIHEVMVLDHSGPDFAMIQYAAMLKLWVLGTLLVGIVIPVRSGWWPVDLAVGIAGLMALAALVGVIESVIARLRLIRVPQFLVAASVLSILALVLVMR
ncbi:MAG: NADH-quinone oxidoreductase subunit H [Planctomycetaceae bacterium]|nr:NADH-quinone oxidoreductase subunit H [Planctomycetaceae bacterium]